MKTTSEPPSPKSVEASARARILDAAYAAFGAKGYEQTSMLEIATRAKVSKRELYALVGAKHDMLVACITERAGRLRAPTDLPEPHDRESLAQTLTAFGQRLIREVSDPTVLGVFRLAIAEADRAPEIAQALDSIARAAARKALAAIFERAADQGLVSGRSADMTARFLALLWGDLMVGLLMRLAGRPTPDEAEQRARAAVTALLSLH